MQHSNIFAAGKTLAIIANEVRRRFLADNPKPQPMLLIIAFVAEGHQIGVYSIVEQTIAIRCLERSNGFFVGAAALLVENPNQLPPIAVVAISDVNRAVLRITEPHVVIEAYKRPGSIVPQKNLAISGDRKDVTGPGGLQG